MEFSDYLSVIRRRKWLVAIPVLGALALAISLNAVTEPVYRATAKIEIDREPTRSMLTGREIDNRNIQIDNMALYTTAQRVMNRDLLGRVAVALQDRAGVFDEVVQKQDVERQVDWLLSRLTVEPIRDTRVVNIYFEHAQPQRAREIVDLTVWYFVESQSQRRAEDSEGLVTYLRQQVAEIKDKIQHSEQALMTAGHADPFSLQDRLKQLSTTLSDQQRGLGTSNRDLAAAREVYKDHHPKRIALETENEAIRENIAANQREMAEINASLQRQSVSQSELGSDRELHNLLLSKLQEAEINGKVENTLVEVVQSAVAGQHPIRPRKMINIVVCLLAGLFTGLGLAFLREYMRRTIRTPDDVAEHLELPVLGLIPKVAQS